jgi:phosphatidylglycerol:prolipoprotein diacylglycerol transferase
MDFPTLFSYIIWNVDSDIFVIPYLNHPVKWYGLSWAVGFLLSQQIMYYIFRQEGKSVKDVDTLTVYIIFSAFLGARLGHFIFYDPSMFVTDPLQVLLPPYAGLASHGGAMGILLALYFFAKKINVKYLWIVDRLVIVSALTGSLIRLGNLMNSEMIGLPTTMPWGFIFLQIDNIPRHPAQLYEAIYCLLLFLFLFFVWYRKRNVINDGFFTGWFLIILFTLRFIDEFFKINQESFENDLILNMGQILSIPFVIGGIIILLLSRRNKMNNELEVMNESPNPKHV